VLLYEGRVRAFRGAGVLKNRYRQSENACIQNSQALFIPGRNHSSVASLRHIVLRASAPVKDACLGMVCSEGMGMRDERCITVMDSHKTFPYGGRSRIFTRGMLRCNFMKVVMPEEVRTLG
jgi:hypothetical protein